MNPLNSTRSVAQPTILLVEDLSDDVFFFKQAIKRSGVKVAVHVAEDGTEAVDYLSNRGKFVDPAAFPKPDLIFLDLKMPNMNGFEVLEWLSQQETGLPQKVVVLSGSEEPGDRARAQSLGALAYMIKPPTAEKLKAFLSFSSVEQPNATTPM